MEMEFHTELQLENYKKEGNILKVHPDLNTFPFPKHLVGLQIEFEGKNIEFFKEEDYDGPFDAFYLDKFQIGCLIDYLTRIHSTMD